MYKYEILSFRYVISKMNLQIAMAVGNTRKQQNVMCVRWDVPCNVAACSMHMCVCVCVCVCVFVLWVRRADNSLCLEERNITTT